MKKFKVIQLRNNRITDSGLVNIINSMPINIKNIDISYNCFTYFGLVPLINKVQNNEFNSLTEINVEGNNLGDNTTSKLLTALTDYSKIRKLNLSKNQLTALSISQLSNFI